SPMAWVRGTTAVVPPRGSDDGGRSIAGMPFGFAGVKCAGAALGGVSICAARVRPRAVGRVAWSDEFAGRATQQSRLSSVRGRTPGGTRRVRAAERGL